jgi:hypothetical protein
MTTMNIDIVKGEAVWREGNGGLGLTLGMLIGEPIRVGAGMDLYGAQPGTLIAIWNNGRLVQAATLDQCKAAAALPLADPFYDQPRPIKSNVPFA